MNQGNMGRMALAVAGAALVLGVAGCSDPEAAEQAYKAEVAKAEKASADDRSVRAAGYATECLSALQWQRASLAGAGVGNVDLYLKHYRGQLEKALGDSVIPAADGAPELSKASIDPYLTWALDHHVKTKFTSGKDWDNDGTITTKEKNAQGYMRVTACIQQAAEAGVGPLAGKDKTGRMFKMEALRGRLDRGK